MIDVQCYKRLGQFCLDVEFQACGVLGLLGPSGSGKSKTLQCIAGIERPDRGRIAVSVPTGGASPSGSASFSTGKRA